MLFTSVLINGTVRLAPSVEAEAPTIPSLLAFGPMVVVLVQPAPTSMTTAIAISVFMFLCV